MAISEDMPTDLIDREQDTRQRLAYLTRSLRREGDARMMLREPEDGLSLESDDRRAALARTQTEHAAILAEMKTVSPEYSSLVDPVPASLNDISASLSTDQVLIEYLVADSSTIAFVVTPDTTVALVLDIGREPLGDLVRFSRGVIARGDKVDTAEPDDVDTVEANIRQVNPEARIIRASSPVSVDDADAVRGKRVLLVEDGPTLTHGEMRFGAAHVAAKRFGAASIVDPRPFAVGSIRETLLG